VLLFEINIAVIMRFNLQIQAAVLALRNTRGLPWPKDHKKKKDEDILDWLQAMFGFQVAYVSVFDVLLLIISSFSYLVLILRRMVVHMN